MSIKHVTAVLAALGALALAVPAAASADISSELAAGRKVERAASRYYPRYHVVANCDQETRTYSWCDVSGQNGDCFIQGNASVRVRYSARGSDWWTTLKGIQRTCY